MSLHIKNFLLPQFQGFSNDQFANGSFQCLWKIQDGTPALRLLAVTERLAEGFDNYVVALQHKVAWPLPSPALTTCDLFVEFFRHTPVIIDLYF